MDYSPLIWLAFKVFTEDEFANDLVTIGLDWAMRDCPSELPAELRPAILAYVADRDFQAIFWKWQQGGFVDRIREIPAEDAAWFAGMLFLHPGLIQIAQERGVMEVVKFSPAGDLDVDAGHADALTALVNDPRAQAIVELWWRAHDLKRDVGTIPSITAAMHGGERPAGEDGTADPWQPIAGLLLVGYPVEDQLVEAS